MKKKNLLLIVASSLCFTTVSFAQVPSFVPAEGLVGWWPFNGNANDESGNGNDGTVNGAILTTDRNGNENSAYSFDGVDDYIQTAASGIIGRQSRTFSFWVLTNSSEHQAPIDYTGSGSAFSVVMNNPCPGVGVDCGSGVVMKGDNNLINDSWHHCVIIFDSLIHNTISDVVVFIDGEFQSGNACSALDPNCVINNTNSADLVFGKTVSNVRYVNGSLDDIGIWNRALTPEEITALYNGTSCAQNTMITPGVNEISIGGTATFTASSDDANPTYFWQSDLGQGYQSLNEIGNYSGTQTSSLSIANVQLANHMQSLRVISTSGVCTDTSNVAYIQILDTCVTVVTDTIITEIVDTTYVTQNIYDTLTTQVYDTTYVTQNIYDTVTTQVFDTTYITLNVYDTLLTTVTDTLIIQTQISGITPASYNTLRVFPNPASTHITIDYGNFAAMNGYTLTIINSVGQTVFTTLINQQTSYIDLATWTGAGMYYVQLIDPLNHTVENRKIVLE